MKYWLKFVEFLNRKFPVNEEIDFDKLSPEVQDLLELYGK